MADPAQAPQGGEGTIPQGPDPGTTQGTPAPTEGQAAATASQPTGQAASGQAPEDTFFDPSQLPPDLQPAYKLMQSAFTKKMTELSDGRRKIQALEQFAPVIEQYQRDPLTVIQQLASQHGLQITRAQAAAVAQQQGVDPNDWDANPPASWKTVRDQIKAETRQEVLRELQPVIGNVQQMQAKNIEAQLDGIDPEWRTYESAMMENMRKYPAMVNDVSALYRLSVPSEVIEARATQAALSKMQRKTSDARASGTSTVRSAPAAPEIKSFNDAVAFAKAQLNQGR